MQRLADAGAVYSVGSLGDSYDNALAESFNGLFRPGLIRPSKPCRRLDDLKLAVVKYVNWLNWLTSPTPSSEMGMIGPPRPRPNCYQHSDRTTRVHSRVRLS
jgi:transposase InsO family protein